MAKPKACVLTGYGINCDIETQRAFEEAGADAERVLVKRLITGKADLSDYQILAFPGGFSYADDVQAGRMLAIKFKYRLGEQLERFREARKPIIGICNGYQAMINLGVVPALDGDYTTQTATLTDNDSGRFEDRWVNLEIDPDSPCIFTEGIERLQLPVRHGEGKFVPDNIAVLDRIDAKHLAVCKYRGRDWEVYPGYPWNPNGSVDDIAGICDETGTVFGLMPHPEAFLDRTQHPRWTREYVDMEESGRNVFKNAVRYASRL